MSTYYFYDPKEPVPFTYLSPTRMVGQIPPPYDSAATPATYLEFAIADVKEGSDRGYVNAFTNVKRALHLAIDVLLHQYGLFHAYRKDNFPGKLSLLDTVGILPTTIVTNLNLERNLVEHEYAMPAKKRVDEAIDVAKLIIMAMETLVSGVVHEAIVGWR